MDWLPVTGRSEDPGRIGCCTSDSLPAPSQWMCVVRGPEEDCARELKLVKRHGEDAERWILIPLER
jgi:hypothetical protein